MTATTASADSVFNDADALVVSASTRGCTAKLMQRIGHPTDAWHDDDSTDRDGVDRLGRELAQLAAAADSARS